jgi:hypothetical protein
VAFRDPHGIRPLSIGRRQALDGKVRLGRFFSCTFRQINCGKGGCFSSVQKECSKTGRLWLPDLQMHSPEHSGVSCHQLTNPAALSSRCAKRIHTLDPFNPAGH